MKRSIYSLICLVSLFFSCSDEQFVDPLKNTDEEKCRIVFAEMTTNPDKPKGPKDYSASAVINYDDKHNLTGIVSTNDSAFRSFTTHYTPTQLTLKSKYHGDMIYKLDNAGRVAEADLYSGMYKFKLTYNAEGYLSKVSKTGPNLYDNINYKLSYANGNLSEISGTALDNFSTKETFECIYSNDGYTTLTSDTNPLTYIMIFDALPSFFGKVSKNLISSITRTYINKGNYIQS